MLKDIRHFVQSFLLAMTDVDIFHHGLRSIGPGEFAAVINGSSDDDADSYGFRRWRLGSLTPAAGVEIEFSLPEPLDKHDVNMLLVYWNLFCCHHKDQECRSHWTSCDIPQWSWQLFSDDTFQWTFLRVQALRDSLLQDLADVPDAEDTLDVAASAFTVASGSTKVKKPTKFGRCSMPTCDQRAFRPMLGSRGPFLVCGRRVCRNTRDLTVEEWKKLPPRWLDFWPLERAHVAPRARPSRPVMHLKSRRRR